MLTVNTNVMATQAHKNQAKSEQAFSRSVQRLASGQRINSAKDDAAGSSIINRMTASLRANSVVTRGLNDTISLMQVAEGGLDSINNMIQRARTLAVQAANGTLSDADSGRLGLHA